MLWQIIRRKNEKNTISFSNDFYFSILQFNYKQKRFSPKNTPLVKESAHNWETVMPNVMMAEATNPDWYGEDNPLVSLRKQGKMSEREYYFLDYLGKLLQTKLQMRNLIVLLKY